MDKREKVFHRCMEAKGEKLMAVGSGVDQIGCSHGIGRKQAEMMKMTTS